MSVVLQVCSLIDANGHQQTVHLNAEGRTARTARHAPDKVAIHMGSSKNAA